MSAVLTNDIYKRLINPNATLMFVARFNIVLIGLLVIIIFFFVDKLGGAFEANKILTGLCWHEVIRLLILDIVLMVKLRKASNVSTSFNLKANDRHTLILDTENH